MSLTTFSSFNQNILWKICVGEVILENVKKKEKKSVCVGNTKTNRQLDIKEKRMCSCELQIWSFVLCLEIQITPHNAKKKKVTNISIASPFTKTNVINNIFIIWSKHIIKNKCRRVDFRKVLRVVCVKKVCSSSKKKNSNFNKKRWELKFN